MTTREAVAIAKQMKNHYGAFAHIESVLTEVSAAKNVVGELTKQRDLLSAEEAGHKQDITRATARIRKKLDNEGVTELEVTERAAAVRARLDDETRVAREASKKAITALKVNYLAEESKLKISIEALKTVEKDSRERAAELEKIYAAVKAKVSKL